MSNCKENICSVLVSAVHKQLKVKLPKMQPKALRTLFVCTEFTKKDVFEQLTLPVVFPLAAVLHKCRSPNAT